MTGWLVASFDFPDGGCLGWALVLPFAVPTYIAAYAYVEALDYFAPCKARCAGSSSASQPRRLLVPGAAVAAGRGLRHGARALSLHLCCEPRRLCDAGRYVA